MNAAVPTLSGPRCTLRALRPADAPAIARHADDPAVALNLHDGFPQPYTLALAEAWCARQHREPQFGHVFAIDVGGEAIGCIGLVPQAGRFACNAEVGYWIGRAFWGRGIGRDALALVSDWAWTALPQLTRLYAPIYRRNPASQRMAVAAGYRHEADLPSSVIKAGEVIDVTLYARYRTPAVSPP